MICRSVWSIVRVLRRNIGIRSHSFRRLAFRRARFGLARHRWHNHFRFRRRRSNASFIAKVVLESSFLRLFVVRFLVQNLARSRRRTNRIRIRSGSVLSSIRSVLSKSWALPLLTLQAKV